MFAEIVQAPEIPNPPFAETHDEVWNLCFVIAFDYKAEILGGFRVVVQSVDMAAQ